MKTIERMVRGMSIESAKRIMGFEQMTQHQLYNNQHDRFVDTRGNMIRLAGKFAMAELLAMAFWLIHKEEFGNGDATDLADDAEQSGGTATTSGDNDSPREDPGV